MPKISTNYGHSSGDLLALKRARELAESGAGREIRQAAHISLLEMARVLGVEPSTLGRWERNERRPSARLAPRYAAVLAELAGDSE